VRAAAVVTGREPLEHGDAAQSAAAQVERGAQPVDAGAKDQRVVDQDCLL